MNHSRCPKSSIPSLLLSCCLAFLGFQSAVAQPVPQDKPGVAMVKPQAWSKDDQATVLEFLSASHHTGYYQFRTSRNPSQQVPSAKVVAVIFYPEPPGSITSAAQREALQKTIAEFTASQQRFPSAARLLDQALAPLKADAAKFDAGNIKENGVWEPRSTYFQKKAAALSDLIKPEILSAPKIQDLVLEEDQYYIGLKDLAASEPSVQSVLKGVQALYDSRVRKDECDALLAQLKARGLSYDAAAALVAKLRSLNPRENATAILYLQSWDAAVAKAGELKKQVEGVQSALESAMEPLADSSECPTLPPALADSISSMRRDIRQYRAGSPPTMIPVPLPLADALTSFADNLPVLSKQFAEKSLLDAKTVLDSLVRQATLIGPHTTAAISGVQSRINSDVIKFLQLRDEAKMLASNDKIEQALKKYQEAYTIIPEKDIAEQIEALKKQ